MFQSHIDSYCNSATPDNYSPEAESLLTFEQLQDTLLIYHQSLPLNEQERSTLKGMFVYMFMATLVHLSYSNGTEKGIKVTQDLLRLILSTSEQELLSTCSWRKLTTLLHRNEYGLPVRCKGDLRPVSGNVVRQHSAFLMHGGKKTWSKRQNQNKKCLS